MDINILAEQSAHIEHVYKVTPEIYYAFQRCSDDYNPLHTDAAFAERKGFSERVMYGNILNCFVSHFVGMLLPSRNIVIQTQDIQFHKPVFLNDEIHLESSIETVSDAVNIINYKLKFYTMVDYKKKIVAKGHVQIGLLKED